MLRAIGEWEYSLLGSLSRRHFIESNGRNGAYCLINQLERELDLPGRTGGFADDAKAAAAHDVVG